MRANFIDTEGHSSAMGADLYNIDIVPEDYEEGGKYWQAPIFDTREYGGAIPIVVSAEDYEIPDNVQGFLDFVTKPIKKTIKAAGKVAGDIVHTANQAARTITSPLNSVPVLGDINKTILNADPAVAITKLANSVIAGERIDKAFIEAGRGQLKAIKDLAPYAQFVASFVPGVGTGVAAALAAGVALSEGRTITDAVIDGVINAVPGGPLVKGAAKASVALADGKSLDAAGMAFAKANLPKTAYTMLDFANKAARGRNIPMSALRAVRNTLPKDLQKGMDIGLAIGEGRNIQSKVLNAVVKNPPKLATLGAAALKKASPSLTKLAPMLKPVQRKGFETAVGLLSQKGANAHQIVALRSAIPSEQRKGFDIAVKHVMEKGNPQFKSLVSKGLVLRGNWAPCGKLDSGAVVGRLIAGKSAVKGCYRRI